MACRAGTALFLCAGLVFLCGAAPAEPVSTKHTATVGGRQFAYQARAGRLQATDEQGKPRAEMFFVSYERLPAEPAESRPVTFAFNGGPGASSAWLHLAALGPRRVDLGKDGMSLPAKYALTDNEDTWLPFTDLVFVDPVGTGFSRPAEGVKAEEFYSVEGDLRAMEQFIRAYLTAYGRWLSPKFLAGESYGTTRAAALADRAQQRAAISFNGLVLISSALDFQTFSFDSDNLLPYALYLPTYTAVAWYHKRLPDDIQTRGLQKAVDESARWAVDTYLPALVRGNSLTDDERGAMADKLARYTGLSRQDVDASNLRIRNAYFATRLLADSHLKLGILDGRVTGPASDRPDVYYEDDPSLFLTAAPLAAAMNDYVRSELNYRSELPYVVLSEEANRQWKWGIEGQGYLDVVDNLGKAMNRDPRMKVFLAAGRYDLDCAFQTGIYEINHLGVPPKIQANATMHLYDAGHQVYTYAPALKQFTQDVEAFFKQAG